MQYFYHLFRTNKCRIFTKTFDLWLFKALIYDFRGKDIIAQEKK
jgi:hypothetical protein